MRDKHIHIASDSELLKRIYKQVDEKLVINPQKFLFILWSKLILYVSLVVLFYTGLYFISSPVLFCFCFISYGISMLVFAFNFSHDLSHNTVFKNKRTNHFYFTVIYTMVGAHAAAWKQRHVHSHHYAPNVEDYDSDLRITKLIRVIPGSNHYWYHRFQHLYAPLTYTTYSLFWIFIKDVVILFSKDVFNEKKDFRYHLYFWLQKTIYITITVAFPIMYSLQPWYMVLSAFILMHLFQSLFLLFTFFMTHHVESTCYPTTDSNGYIDTSWFMNQVKSSNDMHPFSKTANFILGGFNNHIAHHLFPHVHHIYYPQLNGILYSIMYENNIRPNYTTYWGGIVSHLKLLKKMGKNQD